MNSEAIIAIIIIVIALSVRSKAKKTAQKRPGATPQTITPKPEETPAAEREYPFPPVDVQENAYPFPPVDVQEDGKQEKKEPRPASAAPVKNTVKTEQTACARFSPEEMRRAVITNEILGKPVSMRDEN